MVEPNTTKGPQELNRGAIFLHPKNDGFPIRLPRYDGITPSLQDPATWCKGGEIQRSPYENGPANGGLYNCMYIYIYIYLYIYIYI